MAKEVTCKKCDSGNVSVKRIGNSVGWYCEDCGTHIRKLGARELKSFEKMEADRYKESDCVQCLGCGFEGELSEWFAFSQVSFYACPECGTVRFINKDTIKYFQNNVDKGKKVW